MHRLAPLLTILLALPAGSTGVLELRSQPGVEVLWEGVALGETDASGLLVIAGIPPGEYHLTLRKQGFHDLDTRLEVAEGSGSTRELLLKPLAAPAGRRAAPERPASGSRAGGGESRPPAPARKSAETPADRRSSPPADSAARPAAETGAATAVLPPVLGATALVLALLAGAAGAKLLSSRRKTRALSRTPAPGAPFEDGEISVFEACDRDSPAFLEDLRRRERKLGDARETPPRRPTETIIEVEAVEVRPAGARSADKA